MIVLFDRDCGFCAWTLACFLRWDRRGVLRPAPIQGPDGKALLRAVPTEARLASWHAVDEHGRLHSGGAALTEVMRRLPGGLMPAALTALAPRLTERVYSAVAANRTALARPLREASISRARALVGQRAGVTLPESGRGSSCSIRR